ncbi:hypothetical protein MPPM_3571 [Methylorubrum populi]|uniref:Uncharacterized protein n=1 Tax=Methylorubrum populi TaxID=223967 RepID=A0A160PH80_9HYPH|nr:hypothetical protein [Methylorubrum populi]BAU92176.1 hypothetical protein MPPM_3571 [Methylorubrum populi]
MLRFASVATALLMACATTITPVSAQSARSKKGTWTALPSQVVPPAPPRVANGGFGALPLAVGGSSGYCDIVVKRGGGNPTQDMTGSIGHAKSYQATGGGPARQRVCSR